MPTLQIPEKLTPLIERKKRIKLAVGGRGGGKSIAVADMFIMLASHGKSVCCGREFQNSIDDSVHSLMCNEIERLGAPGFTITNNRITHESGGQIFYKGLARNPESLKSLSGVDYFWVEEAQTISEKSLKLLTPSVRSVAGSTDEPEIWFTMNRGSSADPIVEKYLKRAQSALERDGYYEDDLVLAIEISFADNPWFPSELEAERLDDLKSMSRAKYRHVWEGEFNDDVENSIIPAEWFDAAIDAHKALGWKMIGKRVISHDPSDEGDDDKGLAYRHGSVFLGVLSNDKGNVNDGCDWATDYAINNGADVFVWDGDGLGITLRKQVADNLTGQPIDQEVFRGSASPDNPDALYERIDNNAARSKTNKQTFKNKRSQYYWALRDRFYNTFRAVAHGEYHDPDTMISLSSGIKHIDKLRSEICRIPLKPNGNGLIQIMSKEDMAKLDIASPNMADAVMMSLAIPDKIVNTQAVIPPPIRPMGQQYGPGRNQRTRR